MYFVLEHVDVSYTRLVGSALFCLFRNFCRFDFQTLNFSSFFDDIMDITNYIIQTEVRKSHETVPLEG